MLDFLAVIMPLAIAILSVYVSIKLTKGEEHRGWWALILILGVATSVITWLSQSNARNSHEAEQQILQGKLDSSLQAQQYARGQLDSISSTLGTFIQVNRGKEKPTDVTALAAALKQAAGLRPPAAEGTPHLIKVENMAPGNFTVAHQLNCVPSAVTVQMTSLGSIVLQGPKQWDQTNIYLTASADHLTADILIWCQQK